MNQEKRWFVYPDGIMEIGEIKSVSLDWQEDKYPVSLPTFKPYWCIQVKGDSYAALKFTNEEEARFALKSLQEWLSTGSGNLTLEGGSK